jgi:hypothetical protein
MTPPRAANGNGGGRLRAAFPAAAIALAYLAFMAALVLIHPASRNIDAHETQYAYYPALLALRTRAALVAVADGTPIGAAFGAAFGSFRDLAQGVHNYHPPAYPLGILVPYFLVFLAAGKHVLALRFFHLFCHAITLPLVYWMGLRAHDDPRDGRATAVAATVLTATYPHYAHNVIWTQMPEEAASLPVFVAAVAVYLRVGLRGRGAVLVGLLAALASFVKIHLGPLLLIAIAIHRVVLNRRRPAVAIGGIALAGSVFAAAIVPLILLPLGFSEIAQWLFTEESVDLLHPSAAGTAERIAAMAEHALSPGAIVAVWRRAFEDFQHPAITGGLWLALVLAVLPRPRERGHGPASARTPEQAGLASLCAAFAGVGFGLSTLLYFRLFESVKDLFYHLFPFLFLLAAIGATGLLARLGRVRPWLRGAGLAGFAALGGALFVAPLASLEAIRLPAGATSREMEEVATNILEHGSFPSDTVFLFTGVRSLYGGRLDRNFLPWHTLRPDRPSRIAAPTSYHERKRHPPYPLAEIGSPIFAQRLASYRAMGYGKLLWIGCSPAAGPRDEHDPRGAAGRGVAEAGWTLEARVSAAEPTDPPVACEVRTYRNPDARSDGPVWPYLVAQYLAP